MIALIASARPERNDRPTYYTVPWCPMIEKHSVPQIPGAAMQYIRRTIEICRERGLPLAELVHGCNGNVLCFSALMTGNPLGVLMFEGARRIMAELEMFPKPGVHA